jgi:hypothetical protein
MANSVAYKTPPIQPGVAPDPNYLMRDLDFQFMRAVRTPPAIGDWHRRFAWEPSMAFSSLRVDMPIDLSSFAFSDWKGVPTFRKGTNTKIRIEVEPFWEGTKINTRELEHPESAELIAFEQRAQGLMRAWDQHLPPKIYAMLNAAEAVSYADGHPVTGATNFFSTSHYVNVDHMEYGTFANLIGNGGALAASPIYAIVGGGAFDSLKPWAILKGTNLAAARAKMVGATSTAGGGNGDPWVIHWEARDERDMLELNFERRMGVYAERGIGMLFPHTIIRFEGTLDYAGLLSIVDAAGDYKDLNGYMQADQTRVVAFLCHTTAQKSTINGLLGRDITDTASTGVKIDERLKSAEVIVMSR